MCLSQLGLLGPHSENAVSQESEKVQYPESKWYKCGMIPDRLSQHVHLVPIAPGRDQEFALMLEEFRAAGELDAYSDDFAVAWKDYSALCELLSQMKLGGFPRSDSVPTDSYFIEAEGRILGDLYIRHRLSAKLEQLGGHISYMVRPSCRNRGVATAALRLALQFLGNLNVERALVTCKSTNIASARVIEKCGGVRISDAPRQDGVTWRYWLATTPDTE
jgi:predicted acetyltransferase